MLNAATRLRKTECDRVIRLLPARLTSRFPASENDCYMIEVGDFTFVPLLIGAVAYRF